MLKKFIFAAAHLIFWAVFISLSLQVGFRVSQGWDLFLSLYPVYLIHLLWAATAVYLFYFRLADILLESRRAVKFLLVTIIASPVIAMVYFSLIYPRYQTTYDFQIVCRFNDDYLHHDSAGNPAESICELV